MRGRRSPAPMRWRRKTPPTWWRRSTLRAQHHLRLVVKGGGHSYQGTSDAPDSLLIWPRHMNKVTLHDAFVAQGCAERAAAGGDDRGRRDVERRLRRGHHQRAVATCRAAAAPRWASPAWCRAAASAVSRSSWGTAAANLLEAEIVTADGEVRIANACSHPDLFWGIKGGGGGSLGTITRLTLRTFELPAVFGAVFGSDQGGVRRRVPRADRQGDGVLSQRAVQPALGRADVIPRQQHAERIDGVPGLEPAAGGAGLGAVSRLGPRPQRLPVRRTHAGAGVAGAAFLGCRVFPRPCAAARRGGRPARCAGPPYPLGR